MKVELTPEMAEKLGVEMPVKSSRFGSLKNGIVGVVSAPVTKVAEVTSSVATTLASKVDDRKSLKEFARRERADIIEAGRGLRMQAAAAAHAVAEKLEGGE